MESSTFIFKKLSSSPFSSFVLTKIIPVTLLLLLSPFLFSHHHHSPPPPPRIITVRPPQPQPDSFIVNTCANTLYPSLCTHTLSTFPQNLHHNNHTRLRHALQYTIQKTINRVTTSRTTITASLNLDVQENMWINNCVELLHLTTYELQESIKHLHPIHRAPPSYDTMKILLGAAMTNKKTCMQDFFHLKLDYHTHSRVHCYMKRSLTPVMHMICNSLGIINYVEYKGLRGYSCPVLDDRF
ncbi:putative pectinesterase [Helianthus annuus]|nr:putative pectinesterase [Helianthus annuus]KAJ0618053.1 putative pectinesterase [Helianthus annuus]